MVEAALRLLLRALRKGNAASDRSPANLGMMDGLLPVLGRALRSRHAAVTGSALRCLALLAPLPLPGQHSLHYYYINSVHKPCLCNGVNKRRLWSRTFLESAEVTGVWFSGRYRTMQDWNFWHVLHDEDPQVHAMTGCIPVIGVSCFAADVRCCTMTGVLAGLPTVAPEAGAAVLAMLRNAPDCNAPIAQEGFKLLAALLRSCSSYKVPLKLSSEDRRGKC